MYNPLPHILAFITGKARYRPKIDFSGGKSYVYDLFRLYEKVFGRAYGIRKEVQVDTRYTEDGTLAVEYRFYTIEAFLVHQEGEFRKWFKRNVPKVKYVQQPQFQFANGFDGSRPDALPFYRFAIAREDDKPDSQTFTNSGTSLSVSVSTSGSDRLLVGGFSVGNIANLSDVTYPKSSTATSLTEAITETGGANIAASYYMVAPDTGANNYTITTSSSMYIYPCVAAYSGVDQTTPINDTSKYFDPSNTFSRDITVTSSTADCWANAVARDWGAGNADAGTNATEIVTNPGIIQMFDSNGTFTTGNYTMTITTAANTRCAIAAIAMAPAGAAATAIPRAVRNIWW